MVHVTTDERHLVFHVAKAKEAGHDNVSMIRSVSCTIGFSLSAHTSADNECSGVVFPMIVLNASGTCKSTWSQSQAIDEEVASLSIL